MDSFEMPYGDSDVKRVVAQSVSELGHQMGALIEQRIAELKGSIAAARAETTGADVRMSCLHLAKDTMPQGAPSERIIKTASAYTDYVLTGKKPGGEA